jgi:hypothetical protein
MMEKTFIKFFRNTFSIPSLRAIDHIDPISEQTNYSERAARTGSTLTWDGIGSLKEGDVR